MIGRVQAIALLAALLLGAGLYGWRFFVRYAPQRVSALPLAVFRIAYGSVLLLEACQLFWLRHLVFDPIPYVTPGEPDLGYLLAAWLGAIACLVLGLFTRTAAVVNYVITLATLSCFGRFEYHLDYILTGVNLLLVFAPVSRRLSLDCWRASRAGRSASVPPGGAVTVSRLYPELLLLVGVGLVYFDSVFYKLASPMWTGGLGVWMPASLPQVTWLDLSPLLDQKWLMLSLGYLTLAFEAGFLVLIVFDRLRPVLLPIGLGLHLGITLAFPIPWFGLAVVTLYLLLVPPAWFDAAERWLRGRGRAPRGRDVPGAPMALPTAHLVRAHAGLLLLLAWILGSQALVTLQAPLATRIAEATGLAGAQRRAVSVARPYTRMVSRPLLGVVGHGVFMDRHFAQYRQMISIVHQDASGAETWLPIYGEDGLATPRNSGRTWVFWNWRVVGAQPDAERLAEGVRRLTAYWAHRHGHDLRDLRFAIRARPTGVPARWEPGVLRRQRDANWRDVGFAGWRDGAFWSEIGPLGADALAAAATPRGLR